MTREQAIAWVNAQDEYEEIDDDELDAACVGLGWDPVALVGDDEDPIDRRWDVCCREAEDAAEQIAQAAVEAAADHDRGVLELAAREAAYEGEMDRE